MKYNICKVKKFKKIKEYLRFIIKLLLNDFSKRDNNQKYAPLVLKILIIT